MPYKKYKNYTNYLNRYNKNNYRQIAFRIRNDEIEVIEHLDKQENKSAYLLELVKEDMKKGGHN